MSQISLKSISGITSITTPAGVDNQLTLHTNNTSQALKLDSAGNIHIHNHINTTGVSTASNFKTGTSNLHSAGLNAAYVDVDDFVDVGSNIKLGNAGVITATSYRGDGSQLTGIVADKIFEGNTEVETIDTGSNGHVKITTEGTERLRIDSVGTLLVAHSNQRNNFNSVASTEHAPIIQLEGVNQKRAISITASGNNDGGILMLARQNGSVGANTVVSSGNQIGRIDFQASGGTNMEVAAQITAEVDGTPGDNDMPGRLLFKTTADGANSATERLRINSSGHVVPGTDSAYDLGLTGTRFRNVYADTLYGSGANLTNIPSSLPPQNLLINGAMLINVRGTDHQTAGSFNPVTSSIYTLDRWKVLNANSFDTDSAKVVQDTGAPTSEGFTKSIMMNIGNTETPGTNHVCGFEQKIEAQNLQHLCYGTSSAKTMTLSFWVYSNKTGTYCVQLIQDDATKYVLYEYTISSSNTWEKKTITIAGNTANIINNDNGVGLNVNWILCCGSGRHVSATSSWASGGSYYATSNQVNLWDHADNYFKMTGCQLQIGSATDFIHEDYGTTLRKCQRYFFALCGPVRYETIGTGMIYYSGTGYANAFFPVSMRTQPALVALSGTSGAYMYQTLLSNTAAYTHQIGIDAGKTTLQSATLTAACPSSRNGEAFRLSAHFSHDSNNGQSFVNFDAEL